MAERAMGPGYLTVRDADGLRHAIRIASIQMLSDGDPVGDTTVVLVAGRAIVVPIPLDKVISLLEGGARPSSGGDRSTPCAGEARVPHAHTRSGKREEASR